MGSVNPRAKEETSIEGGDEEEEGYKNEEDVDNEDNEDDEDREDVQDDNIKDQGALEMDIDISN